jgi:hypothetical protein
MLRYDAKIVRQPRDLGNPVDWPQAIEERYRPAIVALRRAVCDLPPAHRLELEYHLVNECEAARKARDRHAARRRSDDRRSIERARSLAKASKTIAWYMREFSDQAGFIAGGALLALREAGLRIRLESGEWRAPEGPDALPSFVPDGKPVRVEEAVGRLAAQLARSAIEHNPAGRGPWVHRSSIPGARFAKPLDDARHKKLVNRATVLGFHLVFWLRAFSMEAGTVARPRPSDGAPMPMSGKPHYKVAEEFIWCAFGDEMLEDQQETFDLADRLRKLPQMQYLSW